MTKPLSLFLPSPYTPTWSVVHRFGSPTGGTTVARDLRLETTGTDFVRASCAGSLSIHPPSRTWGFNPVIPPVPIGFPIPDRVSLYLNMQPVTTNRAYTSRAAQILDVAGFLYKDLDGTSLEAGLGALLDKTLLGNWIPGGLTRKLVVELLLAGTIQVFVPAGHDIARAGIVAGSSKRQFAISSMALPGPWDAVMAFDYLRDYVNDGQPAVDALLAFAPWSWAIDPTIGKANAIDYTRVFTFPFAVLQQMRTNFSLTPAEWRQVGDQQKALYMERLRVRAGLAPASPEPPFEFDDPDYKNIFQLEAITEFYANFFEPWATTAAPRSSTANAITGTHAVANAGWVELDGTPNLNDLVANHDLIFIASSAHPSRTYRIIEIDAAGHRVRIEDVDGTGTSKAAIPTTGSAWRIDPYQKVDLLDPAGTHATASGSVVTLDGAADLTRLWPNGTGASDPVYDTIVLDSVTTGASVFRVLSCDPVTRTVTVSGTPSVSGAGSSWHIKLRPWLIAIDPIGGRISGTAASVDTTHADRLNLDPTVSLAGVNKDFDTIYLPTDTHQGRPRRTYRILEVNDAGHWVRVNDTPQLATPGPWHIQSGVSGVRDGVTYSFIPAVAARGHDHFDAMLYLVFGGAVEFSMQWSTYTSRNYTPATNQNLSTIRGNKAYEFLSYQSGRSGSNYTACDGSTQLKPFRNYSLKLVDFGAGARPGWDELYDGVREARFYFPAVTQPDIATPPAVPGNDGKTDIRLHHSADSGAACSSAGCLVSPRYADLRTRLAELYDAEHFALRSTHDAEIRKVIGITQQQAMNLYEGCISGGLTGADYNDKLVGRIWIIRPDERPL